MKEYPSLMLHNLLNDLESLAQLLPDEIQRGSWLNAYLLAAGMNQILEDTLHSDPLYTSKAAKYLKQLKNPAGQVLADMAFGLGKIFQDVTSLRPLERCCRQIQVGLAALVQELANVIVGGGCADATPFVQASRFWLAEIKDLPPSITCQVMRVPSCFRSFDQQVADLERLVDGFADQWPDRNQPVLVMGIRTSGNYLAPLCASFLKFRGYQDVAVQTMRPGRGFLPAERRTLRTLANNGYTALLIDDPPNTGGTIAHSVEELLKLGFPSQSIVLLLQLLGPVDSMPHPLRKYQSILLPWKEWSIHQKLEISAVQCALNEFWSPKFLVESVERLPLTETGWARKHVYALYQARLVEQESGKYLTRHVFVKGAGLGYFGEHTLAVAQALQEFMPEVYGYRDGLLYRAWLPEENRLSRLSEGQEKAYSTALAEYVVTHARSLPTDQDASQKLLGGNSTWEVASNLLSRSFGPGWPLARILFVDRIVRRLLDVDRPSIIDGKMDLQNWFVSDTDNTSLIKIDFGERDFSNLDLYCYDPAFDLADLATSRPQNGFSEGLRQAYQELSGKRISPERWLIYQWVHLWDQQRQSGAGGWKFNCDVERLFQRYFTELYFQDLDPQTPGLLCALDLDGVLETHPYGFPQLTPTSAISLRALILHGYRPLIASGRHLAHVRDRCQAYHLAGGVAEYGSVFYNHITGKVQLLLSEEQCDNLDRLRVILSEMDGVSVDPEYQYAIRAYYQDIKGNRQSLSRDRVASALELSRLDLPIQAIYGEGQTDFIPAQIDKGSGLRQLVEDLEGDVPGGNKPLAFSIGDTAADLPMFSQAARSYVPAHTDPHLKSQGLKRVKGPYQSGVFQAVSWVLGHPPGGCPICQWQVQSSERENFLNLLSVQEAGKWGILWRALGFSLQPKDK
jgi:hypothetical protein